MTAAEHRTGSDPSGTLEVVVAADRTRFVLVTEVADLPFGTRSIARQLRGDPPQPEELTNAVGLVVDHVDDVVRGEPAVAGAPRVRLRGLAMPAVAAVELGTDSVPDLVVLDRAAAEDVFRTLATEPTADRRHNPGLPAELVDDVVGACCIVVAIMRSLHLDAVEIATAAAVEPAA